MVIPSARNCNLPLGFFAAAASLFFSAQAASTEPVLSLPKGSGQDYPTKSVRFVVPFPPGGGTDALARIVGQYLSKALGQSMVLDNRPGAGANIGADIAAHSASDGYTLLMGNIAHAVNATLYRKLSYDFVKDFDPITLLASAPNMLVTHPSVAAKSVQELIALAKSRRARSITRRRAAAVHHILRASYSRT